jgi:exodeoxyribonuclease VII small subunit
MERGELPLEESLKLFEEGVKLSRECHTRLNEPDAKVQKLVGLDAQGNSVTEDFEVEEN